MEASRRLRDDRLNAWLDSRVSSIKLKTSPHVHHVLLSSGNPQSSNMQDPGVGDLLQPILGTPKAAVSGSTDFFKDKTIFLTGATGNLGGCLLYKLSAILHARQIYVLCRGSAALAKITITKHMPLQAKDVLLNPCLTFIQGDIKEPNFAVPKPQLEQLEKEVQIIINAAADISLVAPLKDVIESDCMPPLELARMATRFQRLEQFIQISTAYCNSFLPDGLVEEKMYPLGDPEDELKIAQETGSTQYLSQFPAPYYYAKVP